MNWTLIEGKWDQAKADLKARWAKLTDQDIALLGAKKDSLVGKIVERYGILKDEAERQVDEWGHKLREKLEVKGPNARPDAHPGGRSEGGRQARH
jgi:uncharacterized protein YjbJ (UPF0337 family)